MSEPSNLIDAAADDVAASLVAAADAARDLGERPAYDHARAVALIDAICDLAEGRGCTVLELTVACRSIAASGPVVSALSAGRSDLLEERYRAIHGK